MPFYPRTTKIVEIEKCITYTFHPKTTKIEEIQKGTPYDFLSKKNPQKLRKLKGETPRPKVFVQNVEKGQTKTGSF